MVGPLADRLSLWPVEILPHKRSVGVRALRDAMLEADRKSAWLGAFRRYGTTALLMALAAWTALSLAFNQAVLAAIGPTGILGIVVLWLTAHERVSRTQ